MRDAARSYDERTEGLGMRFLDAGEAAVQLVVDMPELGAEWKLAPLLGAHSVRRVPLSVFPYSLVYALDDAAGILVIAVAHARREPIGGVAFASEHLLRKRSHGMALHAGWVVHRTFVRCLDRCRIAGLNVPILGQGAERGRAWLERAGPLGGRGRYSCHRSAQRVQAATPPCMLEAP